MWFYYEYQATEMLERIGALSDKHEVLEVRIDVVEVWKNNFAVNRSRILSCNIFGIFQDTLPTKADKSDLDDLLSGCEFKFY